jgi:PKD repeat protein
MTGTPVTINGTSRTFPYTGSVITLLGPVTGSGVWSDIINVSNDKLIGQYFQVTLRNWNYCNPYDDPNIPGPPTDLVNGDHPPVITTARVLIVDYPNATITPILPVCQNTPPVTLTAATVGGTWSGNGMIGNVFNPTTAGVGTHLIRYSVTNNYGCSNSDTVLITVKPVPNATITPIDTVCQATPPITLTAIDTGGVWSGNGVVNGVFYPSTVSIGSHIVTYSITSNGCSNSDTETITVEQTPNATITPIDTLCENDSVVTLTAISNGGTWSGRGVTNNTFNPSISGPGVHTITYIVSSNGCTDSDTITIVVKPSPNATIVTPLGTVCGDSSPITLTAIDTGGVWSGNGVVGNILYPSVMSIGNHIIRYDINLNGCSSFSQTTVTIERPDATITQIDTLCENDPPVELIANDQGGVWSGDGIVGTTSNPGHTFNPRIAGPGDHLIVYSVNSSLCNDTDSMTITVIPIPNIVIEPIGTVFINDPPIPLQATPKLGIWSGMGVTDSVFNPKIMGPGEWSIHYETIPDRWGCMSDDTIHIRVILPPPPISDFSPDTVGCSPLTVQFINNSLYGEVYNWSFGDGTYSREMNPIHTYFLPGNYIVKLIVDNISGQSVHNSIITVYKSPKAIFETYPTNVVTSEQIVVFQNFSYNASTYLWDFGDGTTSNETNPYHKYENEGKYEVSLWAYSSDGCIDSVKLYTPINVEWKEGHIKFPNVFKWNEMGPTSGQWREGYHPEMDYVFRPFFENVIEYRLQIFNRWGVLIFESNDLGIGWDGYWGKPDPNKLALQGVYVWRVTGRFANGDYFEKVGDVTFLH